MSMFLPGDLLRITTAEGSTLQVIQVNDQPSPYVRFDWDWPPKPEAVLDEERR